VGFFILKYNKLRNYINRTTDSMVIDAEFGKENYSSIPCNCDWEGIKNIW
jgi:hypothetical protein